MDEILEKTGLTQDELNLLLDWFGSETMSSALRFMHKSPSHFYFDEDEEDDFPIYDLWEISCKMKFKKVEK